MAIELLSSRLRFFAIASVVFVGGNFLVALSLYVAGAPEPETVRVPSSLLAAIAFLAVLTPLVETVLLTASIGITSRVFKGRMAIACLGAAPLIALHYPMGLTKVACVAAGFAWSGWCYMRLRAQGASFSFRYWFLFGLHAVNNAIAVVAHFAFAAPSG